MVLNNNLLYSYDIVNINRRWKIVKKDKKQLIIFFPIKVGTAEISYHCRRSNISPIQGHRNNSVLIN